MGNICSKTPNDLSFTESSSESAKQLQLKHFQYIATIGEGSFGKVILAKRKTTEKLYAIKLILTERLNDSQKFEYAKFERQVLIEFQNPFIVKLNHIFESSGKLCFVLDFMQGGSLAFHLHKCKRFKTSVAVFFAAEVVIGLEILHSREFIYRDLKPENILLDINGHIKLADFNLATTVEEMSDRVCGSPEYAAPEVLNRETQGIEVDFWGLGVLLYHMIQGVTPFYASKYSDIIKNILACQFFFSELFSSNAQELISSLLTSDPKLRLTSYKAIKAHKFFEGVDWGSVEKRTSDSPFKLNFKDSYDLKYFKKNYSKMNINEHDYTDLNNSVYSNLGDLIYNSEID